jgi:hypothetical protein
MSRREPAVRCSLALHAVRLATSDRSPLQGSPALATSGGPSVTPCAPDVAGHRHEESSPPRVNIHLGDLHVSSSCPTGYQEG